MIKRYNDKKNVSGNIIKQARENKHLTKTEVCRKLELEGVYLNRDELLLMEKNQLMIKDFELIALCYILDIDINNLKKIFQ